MSERPPKYRLKRKQLILLLLLPILFLGCDRLLGWGLKGLVFSSSFRYCRIYGPERLAYETLIVGDSKGVAGFYAPAVAEASEGSALNLSYNALSPPVALALVRDYLERHEPPGLLVIELNMLQQSGQVLQGLKLFALRSERLSRLYRQARPQAWWGMRISWLYGLNSEVLPRTLYYLNKSDQTWIKQNSIRPDLVRAASRLPRFVLKEPSPQNLAALAALLRLAKERGIETRLVLTPFLPQYAARMQGLAGWLHRVARYLKGRGVHDQRIYNYADHYSQASLFGDFTHLNKQGSILFQRDLKQAGFYSRQSP